MSEIPFKNVAHSESLSLTSDDWDNNRRDAVESPEQRLKSAILKFGEVVSPALLLAMFEG